MLGFFRRRILFQSQASIGGLGRNGNPGATGPAGAAGAAGAAGLGPTVTINPSQADVLAANATPIDFIPATAGTKLIPIMTWMETNVTVVGSNAPTWNAGYTSADIGFQWSSTLTTQRNTGAIEPVSNFPSEVAAFGAALPATGVAVRLTLSAAPTGTPTIASCRAWSLYFAVPALIP